MPRFFRFLGPDGQILTPSESAPAPFTAGLEQVWKGLETDLQLVGFLPLPTDAGRIELQEVIVSRIIHPMTDEPLGALVLAFPVPELNVGSAAVSRQETMLLGFFLDGQLFARPRVMEQAHLGILESELRRVADRASFQRDFFLSLGEEPYRVFYRVPNPGSPLLRAYQVCLYSLADEYRDQRQLRLAVLGFAALGLAGALALATLLSHGLSVPIRELVAATGEIQRGNLAVQVAVRSGDEIGRLASAFNDMTVGLAQKEEYRNLLNLVSDEKVAQQLLAGTTVALGGERREVTILFCDIRGFTERTGPMPPEEVIDMLNEHMTILTRVIKEHNGVVDKFVGDCVMAVFGAPFSRDDDVALAARCALRMVEERKRLNLSSRYTLQIGIGMATGAVVAGCMGSQDRLNYTVLGERVNLASRLAGKAGPMQIVIDATTRERLADSALVEALDPLQLKGFEGKQPAFRLSEVAHAA
ncbi:MAG: hypothetical protein A3H97_08515 [Acidobacteria bacterium RIFCSPLOWO2_02_FULL_65_29]|nr:MAG: hypothetical protein A3H97_08515 [Acidobacteria bacterium RIFCSPLOWO2_02_FULL_65_29]